jgi:hypothetical protein
MPDYSYVADLTSLVGFHGVLLDFGRLSERLSGGKSMIPRFQRRDLHPTDEDLSLHPSKQRSLAGNPESVGTPELGHP